MVAPHSTKFVAILAKACLGPAMWHGCSVLYRKNLS